MWQRFTDRARKTVFSAQEESQNFGVDFVSTEHLLLGLTKDSESTAAQILERCGVSLKRIRIEVEKLLSKGDARPCEDMHLTPRAKRVVDLAYEEARQLGDDWIGTEHLLLGLIREGDGIAGRTLAKLDIGLEHARREASALRDEREPRPKVERVAQAMPSRYEPEPFDWENFDDAAQRTMFQANRERESVADAQVSPLHLFLGLLENPDSSAVQALTRLGLDREKIHERIDDYRIWATGAPHIPLSPNGRKVVDAAYVEARLLGSKHLEASHLLLGLVVGNPEGAGRILADFGVSPRKLRRAIQDADRSRHEESEKPPEPEA